MKNIAVVLAGGMGKRMCSQVPKQFLMLSGRTVIEYSIERFNSHPSIDEVCVVINPEWRDVNGQYVPCGDNMTGCVGDTYKGEKCKRETYVYLIEYRTKTMPLVVQERVGTILLLR